MFPLGFWDTPRSIVKLLLKMNHRKSHHLDRARFHNVIAFDRHHRLSYRPFQYPKRLLPVRIEYHDNQTHGRETPLITNFRFL